jgi:hypothetical protein
VSRYGLLSIHRTEPQKSHDREWTAHVLDSLNAFSTSHKEVALSFWRKTSSDRPARYPLRIALSGLMIPHMFEDLDHKTRVHPVHNEEVGVNMHKSPGKKEIVSK